MDVAFMRSFFASQVVRVFIQKPLSGITLDFAPTGIHDHEVEPRIFEFWPGRALEGARSR